MPKTMQARISKKGCLSLYGIRSGKFPISLYATEWEKVLEVADEIREAITNKKHRALMDERGEAERGNKASKEGKEVQPFL
jgi:hypothetical protein